MRDKKISEIVSNDIRTIPIFSKHEIDFCCGANKTLDSVCREKKIDYRLLIDEIKMLENLPKVPSYNKMELDDLIDHIILEHHDYNREKSIIIKSLLKKVVRKYENIFPELRKTSTLFNQIHLELEQHLIKEENILFPRIIELLKIKKNQTMITEIFYSISNLISVMEKEHLVAGNIFEKINSSTNNYTCKKGACNSIKFLYYALKELENNLHIHIHLENNILFPKALKMERYIQNHST